MVGRGSLLEGLHSHSLVLPVEAAIQGPQILHAALLFQEGHCQGYDGFIACKSTSHPVRFKYCSDPQIADLLSAIILLDQSGVRWIDMWKASLSTNLKRQRGKC